ncbi:hypothetical protein [Succinivibrio sp.]|uniref:hypothetical protein n=1 Tax=Succinivibrio sp. TaxID=2053619 RepID=UPI0025F8F518|nr:hypothetical protein [Succinivibrio sp.]MBQ9220409.1 hypothetical protein [Succinivibrio sp.]
MNNRILDKNLNSLLNSLEKNGFVYKSAEKVKLCYGIASIILNELDYEISILLARGFCKKYVYQMLLNEGKLPAYISLFQFYSYLRKRKNSKDNIPAGRDNSDNIPIQDNVINNQDRNDSSASDISNNSNLFENIEKEREERLNKDKELIEKLSNENGREVEIKLNPVDHHFIHIPKHLFILNETDPKYPKTYPKRYTTRICPEGNVPWQQSKPLLISEDNELYELYSQLPLTTAYSPFSRSALIDFQANIVELSIYEKRLRNRFEETHKVIHGRKIE